MEEVIAEGEVEAPLSDVWKLVSDFVGFIALQGVKVTGDGEGVGMTRTVTLGADEVVERLEELDEEAHRTSYSVVSGPISVPGYISTIELRATAETTTHVTWSGRFEADGAPEQVEDLLARTYRSGIRRLQRYFSPK